MWHLFQWDFQTVHLTGLCFVSAHWVIIIYFVQDARWNGKNKKKSKPAELRYFQPHWSYLIQMHSHSLWLWKGPRSLSAFSFFPRKLCKHFKQSHYLLFEISGNRSISLNFEKNWIILLPLRQNLKERHKQYGTLQNTFSWFIIVWRTCILIFLIISLLL